MSPPISAATVKQRAVSADKALSPNEVLTMVDSTGNAVEIVKYGGSGSRVSKDSGLRRCWLPTTLSSTENNAIWSILEKSNIIAHSG
jgi:hypothetical protein